MARHANRVPLYSVNDYVLRSITIRDAFALLDEGKVGPVKNTRREIVGVQLKQLERNERPSSCSLTRSDAEKNSVVRVGAKIAASDSIAALERAVAKVEAWPSVHDTKAVVISAGRALGVILCSSVEERVVTFA